MLIGISGRARSGKSTAAEYLAMHQDFEVLSFAEPLKEMALQVNPLVAEELRLKDVVEANGWEAAKDEYPEVRHFLQKLGTEGVRSTFGGNAWVNLVEDEIDELWSADAIAGQPEEKWTNVVIPDVRFPEEAAMIRRNGGVVIRVERDSHDWAEPTHASELGVESDLVIVNEEGEPAVLYAQLDVAVGSFTPAPVHEDEQDGLW